MKGLNKVLLACLVTAALTLSAPMAYATCSGGSFACQQSCNASCSTAGGVTFSGMCVGGTLGGITSNCTGTALYVRCSGSAAICVGGPFGASCKSDADCTSTQVCVSSGGLEGCGTGFAVCMTSCSG